MCSELQIFTADCLSTAKLDLCPTTVAGEFVPLNTTVLFVSGITSSAIWMVPTILGFAGVGCTISEKIERTSLFYFLIPNSIQEIIKKNS
jgi:hypothetical protein